MYKTHYKHTTLFISILSALLILAASFLYLARPASAEEMAQIRVHSTVDTDADALPFLNGEGHQSGWKIRLYDNNWNPVPAGEGGSNEVTTTDKAFDQAAAFFVNPGKYYVCPVLQDGYSQAFALNIKAWVDFRDWSIANKSGATDEALRCAPTKKINSGEISSMVFGSNMGGEIRVHQVTDLNDNQWPDFLGEETHAKGWKYRLYKVNHLGEWKGWGNVVTTGEAYHKSANFKVAAGEYRLCQIAKTNYQESYIRKILGYLNLPGTGVTNDSPRNFSENPNCAPLTLGQGEIQSFVFGNTRVDADAEAEAEAQ